MDVSDTAELQLFLLFSVARMLQPCVVEHLPPAPPPRPLQTQGSTAVLLRGEELKDKA